MVNFGYFLLRNADCFPDRTAVVCEDRELTYSQLNAECNRLANALKLKGLRRGDRLALLMKSSTEWLVVWYACQKLGVAVLPLHARLMAGELVRTIDTAGCGCLVFGSEFAGRLRAYCKAAAVSGSPYAVSGRATPADCADALFEELVSEADPARLRRSFAREDESVILFTSGTTGVSKGVLRTQQMVRDHALVSR